MTAISAPVPASSSTQRVVLRGVSWQTYASLIRELEGQHLRLAYDHGMLEIMSPSPKHARIGNLIARLVETFTLELKIPLVALGNATWTCEAAARGLEADECYYIANAQWAAGREQFDLNVDPPPDLAIEVDISQSSLDKEAIYAALGVPELWRFEDERLVIRILGKSGGYENAERSLNLPALPRDVIERFVRLRTAGQTDTQIIASFVEWIRAALRG